MARVLFVDDDPMTLETLDKAVQVFGHQSILAGTAKEALEKASTLCPDIIFIDLRLPDMDGISLIALLKQHEITANIPILMLSAGPEDESGSKARQAGARAYLEKPIRLQVLIDTIQEYTSG